jgi:hypothetical protein
MPPHREKLSLNANFVVLQNVFRFFMDNGYFLTPAVNNFDNSSLLKLDKFLSVSNTSFASSKISDIPTGLLSPKAIAKLVTKSFSDIIEHRKIDTKITVSLEWNYLGKSLEKQQYFDYLDQFYWRNQVNLEHLKLEESQDLLENTWKITSFSDKFEEDLKLPLEFLSLETTKLLDNLSTMMPNWELNPYLILEKEANLQWQIKTNNGFIIQGYIFKQNGNLYQNIKLPNLT